MMRDIKEIKWLTTQEFAKFTGFSISEIKNSINRKRISAEKRKGKYYINKETEAPKMIATSRSVRPIRPGCKKPPPVIKRPPPTPPSPRKTLRNAASDPAAHFNPKDNLAPSGSVTEKDIQKMNLSQAREIQERYKALASKAEYERATGALVPLDDVMREWSRIGILIKKSILNIADRLAPIVAAEGDNNKCWQILDEETRIILEDLTEQIADPNYEGDKNGPKMGRPSKFERISSRGTSRRKK